MSPEKAKRASLSAREKSELIEQTKKQIINLFGKLGYLDQGIVILDLLNEMDLPEWGENIKEMLDIGFQTRPRRVDKKTEVDTSEEEQPPIRIEVDSEFDPSSRMRCCDKPTTQKQIDYRLTLNKQTFEIPNVWASVCSECDNVYFAPEVGNTIDERIFEIQHPERAKWDIY